MIVIFHSQDGQNHCDDGFAAAWVFWKAFPKATFLPGIYGQEPPWENLRGQPVYLVDFSYKAPVMQRLLSEARCVTLIDHHKTAKEELERLPPPDGDEFEVFFDLNSSGAMLAWQYVYGYEGCTAETRMCPELIARIEDNDLWRTPRRFDDSLVVQAALRSYPQTFEVWDDLMNRPLAELAAEGAAIRRFIDAKIAELKRTFWWDDVAGVRMPVCNAPWFLASDLAGQLAEENGGVAAVYFDQPTRRCYSLRARGDHDVSEIAKQMGGGGHKGAAGFEVPKS